MSTKLQSVRRSLFNEYDDHEDDENKSYENSSKHPTHLSFGTVKLSNAFVVCILIGIISIAALTNQLVQNLLIKAGKEMFSKAHASSEWFQESRNNLVEPAIYGLLISIFTAMMVYLDSDIPGLSPPTPFSPRKAKQIGYALHKEKTLHLSYLIALGSGIVTFFILYW